MLDTKSDQKWPLSTLEKRGQGSFLFCFIHWKLPAVWSSFSCPSLLVGVTGFESRCGSVTSRLWHATGMSFTPARPFAFGSLPAASCSQTQKHRFFTSFCVLFRAFSSENRAFTCYKVHNFHVVQTCKWSRLWSESKLHIFSHLARVVSSAPRWLFCYCHYTK